MCAQTEKTTFSCKDNKGKSLMYIGVGQFFEVVGYFNVARLWASPDCTLESVQIQFLHPLHWRCLDVCLMWVKSIIILSGGSLQTLEICWLNNE